MNIMVRAVSSVALLQLTKDWRNKHFCVFFYRQSSANILKNFKIFNMLDKNDKLWYLFLHSVWASKLDNIFCRKDWTLACIRMEFWDFAIISFSTMFLSHILPSSLWGNLCIKYLFLDNIFSLTYGEQVLN